MPEFHIVEKSSDPSAHLQSRFKLNDGSTIPVMGFGVYEAEGEECYKAVYAALEAGYRLIDTAEWYENEKETGKAVRDFMKATGTPRDEIHYTTKLKENITTEHAIMACKRSLADAGLDYIDSYLIHGPLPDNTTRLASWKACEQLYDEGIVRCIGVSNYGIHHLKEILDNKDFKYVPAFNQIDLHPFMQRQEIASFCEEKGIHLEAWGPLARGMRFDHPVLCEIAAKYNKTTAHVLLRWGIEKNYIVIPKSITKQRIISNTKVFDFKLDEDDKAKLNKLEEYLVTDWDPSGDP